MDQKWTALAREAGLAAEHLAIGATAIGRANYAQPAYYGQAFFALSIGLERACKLALLVDYAVETGSFPTVEAVRKYKHQLDRLLEEADAIAARRGLKAGDHRRPQGPIHEGIIEVLSEFATNITRYYNIEVVVGHSATGGRDPVARWAERVTQPVLAAHDTARARTRRQQNAEVVAAMLADNALFRHHAETGMPVESAYEGSRLTGQTEFAQPYTRMYVLHFARFLGNLLAHLSLEAHKSHRMVVPELSEFFNLFRVTDKEFRQRRRWSIYTP